MNNYPNDPSAKPHIDRLADEIADLTERLAVTDTPAQLAEIYSPEAIKRLLGLRQEQMTLEGGDRRAMRAYINQLLRSAIHKVIVCETVTIQLVPVFGQCLELFLR
jgi:hypothetical protein